MIKVRTIASFPPNVNPFTQDMDRMGVQIGTNVMVMMTNHATGRCDTLVIVNQVTGERCLVEFTDIMVRGKSPA